MHTGLNKEALAPGKGSSGLYCYWFSAYVFQNVYKNPVLSLSNIKIFKYTFMLINSDLKKSFEEASLFVAEDKQKSKHYLTMNLMWYI